MTRLLAAGLALALSACAGMTARPSTPAATPPSSGVVARADQVILSGERAFGAAELVYTTAARGVGRLVDAGAIKGALATTVRGWNAEARDLLVAGKATADTAERARAAARLFAIGDRLNALLGRK